MRSVPLDLGNQRCSIIVLIVHRSIPTWVGETSLAGGCQRTTTVYPHVSGGTRDRVAAHARYYGLSPHGRGPSAGRGAGGVEIPSVHSIPYTASTAASIVYRSSFTRHTVFADVMLTAKGGNLSVYLSRISGAAAALTPALHKPRIALRHATLSPCLGWDWQDIGVKGSLLTRHTTLLSPRL